MRFVLEILIIGLLFNSGYGRPSEAEEEEGQQADTPQGDPIFTTRPQEFVATPGADLTLPCVVEHNEGEDSIVWAHNNFTFFVDSHKLGEAKAYSLQNDSVNHTVFIKSYTPDLAGNYTCWIPAKKIGITHVVGPKENVVIESVSSKKFVENLSELSIQCRAKGFPSPTISWFKKSSENSVEQDLKINSPNLLIPAATFSDTGIYTCKADNGETSEMRSVSINVISGLAPESLKVFAGQSEGSSKLCCVFDKSRKVIWLKEGKEVTVVGSDRFAVESEKHKSCLVIKKAKEEDLGTYTCQTEKNAIENAQVELNGAPAKPIAKSIFSNDESKTPNITWAITSVFPISEYKIYTRKAEETEWKELERKTLTEGDKKDEITYIFTNLSNGRYSVKLDVSNKYGSNESIENGAIIVDRIDPNVIMSAKINSGSGADRHYRISSLCVLFVILMRLWSC